MRNDRVRTYPLALLAMDAGFYIWTLISLLSYGGSLISYYAYEIFLDSIMFAFFLFLPIYWIIGSRSNPFWIILLLAPEAFLAVVGFNGFGMYLISMFAQIPLLDSAIERYNIPSGKEHVTVRDARKLKRRARIALFSLVPILVGYFLLVSVVFVRLHWISTYPIGPNFPTQTVGFVIDSYSNLAKFLAASIALLLAVAVLLALYFRFNKRALAPISDE